MTHNPTDRPRRRTQPVNINASMQLANESLSLRLGTTTLSAIRTQTDELVDTINRLTRSPTTGADTKGRQLRQEAAELVRGVPDEFALAYSSFSYMRVLALLLRRLAEYTEEVASEQGGGAIAPRADPAPRLPRGLATIGQRQWLAGVAG